MGDVIEFPQAQAEFTIEEVEEENSAKLHRLAGMGVPLPIVQQVAQLARVETLIETLKAAELLPDTFELLYELRIGLALGEMLENLTQQQLLVAQAEVPKDLK